MQICGLKQMRMEQPIIFSEVRGRARLSSARRVGAFDVTEGAQPSRRGEDTATLPSLAGAGAKRANSASENSIRDESRRSNAAKLRWLLLVPGLLLLFSTQAKAQLQWRVSFKAFVDSAGQLTGTYSNNLRTNVVGWVNAANAVHAAHGRGYEFRMTEFLVMVDSSWDGAAPTAANRDLLQDEVEDDPSHFRYRGNAMNVYITNPSVNTEFGGYCSRPNDYLVIIRSDQRNGTFVHEAGHWLGLCHTQGCSSGPCDPNDPLSDDEIADTIADSDCWELADGSADLNRITTANYVGYANYDSLPSNLQASVRNVAFNIMSYHTDRSIFTRDQLDRMSDTSNDERLGMATGRTWYVDRANGDDNAFAGLSSDNQLQTLTEGVTRATAGEIILLRANTYSRVAASWTINKAVTLRTTRGTSHLRTIPAP